MSSTARADARSAAARLALVPLSPGGPYDAPPLYDPVEIDSAAFGVFLDPELRGQPIEQYLADRALLCAAHYTVELYALADDGLLPASPQIEVWPDTGFALDGSSLTPGGLYAWRVVARIAGRATVASVPLYFRLLPQPRDVPPQLSLEGQSVAAMLLRAASEQRRAGVALALSLNGMRLFETYPTATDSYVCTPLSGEHTAPLPGQLRGPGVSLDLLAELGAILQESQTAKARLHQGEDASAEIRTVSRGVLGLVRSVVYGPLVARGETDLGALAARLAEPNADLLPLLAQLELAIDALVGAGTLNLQQDYQQSFRAYALASEQQLRRAADLAPYFASLEPEWTEEMSALLDTQRAAMLLLREEVERGRLARPQLRQRIAQNRGRLFAQLEAQYTLLEGRTCILPADRARRTTEGGETQARRLEQEVVRCRLFALLDQLWPEM